MNLLTILFVLCLFAAVLYLVNRYAPTSPARTIGLVIVLFALVAWLLNVLGLLGPIVGARI